MTDLDQATKILENIKSEIDKVKELLFSKEDKAPEEAPAPAPSFEAEPKPESSITSKLLDTFNTIKENVEAVIPTKTTAEEAPAAEVPAAEVPAAETPETPEAPAPVPAFEAPEPTPAPAPTEVPETAATAIEGSASENALNAILGASAELPSQVKAPAPALEEPTPAPAPSEG